MMNKQKNPRKWFQRSILMTGIFLCLLTGSAQNVTNAGTSPDKSGQIKIVYIANEGYLIEIGGKKILIDALHTGVSPELVTKMISAEPPFDKVDIILATHSHADHFSPDLVAKHMDKNMIAVFLSNDEAASHVRAYISDFASAAERIKALFPMDSEKIKESYPGVEIQAMSFPHARDTYITNLGFLVKVGGKKFLHMGDSVAALEYLEGFKLSKEKIDVAFIPYWYFSNPALHSAVREGIKAKHIVPMHFGLINGSKDTVLKILKKEFPEAILLQEELDSKTIQ